MAVSGAGGQRAPGSATITIGAETRAGEGPMPKGSKVYRRFGCAALLCVLLVPLPAGARGGGDVLARILAELIIDSLRGPPPVVPPPVPVLVPVAVAAAAAPPPDVFLNGRLKDQELKRV